MSCPRDTNGDGDCGQKYCPHCGIPMPVTTQVVTTIECSYDLPPIVTPDELVAQGLVHERDPRLRPGFVMSTKLKE